MSFQHYDKHPAYKRSPIVETICRIDFPQILQIPTEIPVEFQTKIRSELPNYQYITPDQIIVPPGQVPPDPRLLINHQFVSENELVKVNITQDFFAYTTMRYPGWTDFKEIFLRLFDTFCEIYHPAFVQRVGIKYTNFLPEQLLRRDGKPLSHYVDSRFIAPWEDLAFLEPPMAAYTGTCEMNLENDTTARVNYGIGTILSMRSQMFFIETDVFSQEKRALNIIPETLDKFHDTSYDLFRWMITEDLHEYLSK